MGRGYVFLLRSENSQKMSKTQSLLKEEKITGTNLEFLELEKSFLFV
jgi:hypothetical protein